MLRGISMPAMLRNVGARSTIDCNDSLVLPAGTSPGMLTMKMDPRDLSFQDMNPFDGTFAYAQNKRQQIVMTQQYARRHRDVLFCCMHPGWADTPGV